MKIKVLVFSMLCVASPALPLSAVVAAEGLPGATVTGGEPAANGQRDRADGRREPTAEQRARREQWCKDNAEKCREARAKAEQRREQCKADPAKCRAEIQARQTERFKRADTDGNGTLSRAEAAKGMPALAKHFDQIDANKDGQITREEIEAARKARESARKGKAG